MDSRLDRRVLEDEWYQRLTDAKKRLDLVRLTMNETGLDVAAGLAPSPDRSFTYRKALREENLALDEYFRVLCAFSDLVLYGKIPEETNQTRLSKARSH